MAQTPAPQDPRDPGYEWRRFTSSEEAEAALPEVAFDDPASVALLFVKALFDPETNAVALDYLVTPESRAAWGDFTEAAQMLAEIEDAGFGSNINRAHDAPDVGYLKILRGVSQSYQVTDGQLVMAAAVVTVVWRPEYERWMVHSIGDYLKPEDVPRTSPGSAPE
ncbi:hypothetical protein [Cellulomonas hominis]